MASRLAYSTQNMGDRCRIENSCLYFLQVDTMIWSCVKWKYEKDASLSIKYKHRQNSDDLSFDQKFHS
jgi:hypothetical protein